MAKVKLTKNLVDGLKPVFPKAHPKAGLPLPKGERFTLMDAYCPGFGVRVTWSGQRTYILRCRIRGQSDAIRRAIGEVGAIELADARQRARDWLELVRKSIDPKAEQERLAQEAARRRANAFAAVAEDFIKEKVLGPKCYDEWETLQRKGRPATAPRERKGFEVARDIRREFMPAWAKRPIIELTRLDVRSIINAKKETAPAQARNLLGTAKRLFSWAVDQESYGLEISPAAALKSTKIIGEKQSDDRVLSDDELRALWQAAESTPYPHGPVYKLLMFSALRLNEAADAKLNEFDLAQGIWTIPAERMKGKNGKRRLHEVPIINEILAILKKVPKIKKQDRYLFSTTLGTTPVWMSDKIKEKIDKRMLIALRALAYSRGDDPLKVKLDPWKNHHIRHTIRTRLSGLEIPEDVCEAVVAHVQSGIKGVYNHHKYFKQKRDALNAWADKLRAIVHPERVLESANVTQFRATKA